MTFPGGAEALRLYTTGKQQCKAFEREYQFINSDYLRAVAQAGGKKLNKKRECTRQAVENLLGLWGRMDAFTEELAQGRVWSTRGYYLSGIGQAPVNREKQQEEARQKRVKREEERLQKEKQEEEIVEEQRRMQRS